METKYTVKTMCRFCRREFESFGLRKTCNECESRMDEQFATIRTYIQENPNANMGEICDALAVPTALLRYYLREERLSIKAGGKNLFLKCDNCKKPISTGKYCPECEISVVRNELSGKLGTTKEEEIMERDIVSFHLHKSRLGSMRNKLNNK